MTVHHHYPFLNEWSKQELLIPEHWLNTSNGINNWWSTQLDTWGTHLKEIEVSVELSTFCVLQSFELSRDEHENVLETSEMLTEKSSQKKKTRDGNLNNDAKQKWINIYLAHKLVESEHHFDQGTLSLSGEVYGASGA